MDTDPLAPAANVAEEIADLTDDVIGANVLYLLLSPLSRSE